LPQQYSEPRVRCASAPPITVLTPALACNHSQYVCSSTVAHQAADGPPKASPFGGSLLRDLQGYFRRPLLERLGRPRGLDGHRGLPTWEPRLCRVHNGTVTKLVSLTRAVRNTLFSRLWGKS
jgi:hypothetical protein